MKKYIYNIYFLFYPYVSSYLSCLEPGRDTSGNIEGLSEKEQPVLSCRGCHCCLTNLECCFNAPVGTDHHLHPDPRVRVRVYCNRGVGASSVVEFHYQILSFPGVEL